MPLFKLIKNLVARRESKRKTQKFYEKLRNGEYLRVNAEQLIKERSVMVRMAFAREQELVYYSG